MIKPSAYVREDDKAQSFRQAENCWVIRTGHYGLPHLWDWGRGEWVLARLVEMERHEIDGLPVYLAPACFRLSFEQMLELLDNLPHFPS